MKKIFLALGIISALLVLIGSCVMSGRNQSVEKPAVHVDTYRPENPAVSAPKSLKAGEWSEWADVMTNVLRVWPSSAEVEYECKDVNGKVTQRPDKPGPGLQNWNDLTQFTRVRSKKVDIVYSVERRR